MSTTFFQRSVASLLVVGMVAGGLSLSGCASQAQTAAGVGALGGGLAGGLLGNSKNKEQWALIGAAGGGVLGYIFGNELDKNDQQKLNESLAARNSQPTSWQSSGGGEYRVSPEPIRNVEGRRCRESTIETFRDGGRRNIRVLACERPDGSWEMKELPPPRGGRPPY